MPWCPYCFWACLGRCFQMRPALQWAEAVRYTDLPCVQHPIHWDMDRAKCGGRRNSSLFSCLPGWPQILQLLSGVDAIVSTSFQVFSLSFSHTTSFLALHLTDSRWRDLFSLHNHLSHIHICIHLLLCLHVHVCIHVKYTHMSTSMSASMYMRI